MHDQYTLSVKCHIRFKIIAMYSNPGNCHLCNEAKSNGTDGGSNFNRDKTVAKNLSGRLVISAMCQWIWTHIEQGFWGSIATCCPPSITLCCLWIQFSPLAIGMRAILVCDIHRLIRCDSVSVNSESFADTEEHRGKSKAVKRIVCAAHRCDWSWVEYLCGFRKQEGHAEHLYELNEEGQQV